MRVLGWLFLVGGGLLCLTIILAPFGAPFLVAGALLLIAASISRKRAEEARRIAEAQATSESGVHLSAFGR